MFSIVIPLYNKEDYILRSLSSVLGQTYRDFEVLVINDGSTDNSVSIVEKIQDKRIKLIHKENGGVSSARNTGIENAKYDFIAFLDADDIMHTEYLDEIKDLISKYPKAYFYAVSVQFIKTSNNITYIKPKIDMPIWNYFDFVENGGRVNSSSVTIKKDVFKNVGMFNTNYKMGEDLDMWFRIGCYYSLAFSSRISNTYDYSTPSGVTKKLLPPEQSPLLFSYMAISNSLSEENKSKAVSYLLKQRTNDIVKYAKFMEKGSALKMVRELEETTGKNLPYKILILMLPKFTLPLWAYSMNLYKRFIK